MKSKKLAICFYGQVRYVEGFNLFYKNFRDSNPHLDIDFFISSWKDFDISKINLIFKKESFVLHSDLGQEPLSGNTRKMSYHLKRVLNLKSQQELKSKTVYDAVLTIRPDIVFDTTRMVSNIIDFTSINHSVPTVSIPSGITIQDSTYRVHEDWMFLMNSVGADLHSKLFDFFFIDKEYENENWNYREGGHWIHPHYFLHKAFNVVVLPIPNVLIRPVRDLKVLEQYYNSPELIKKIIINSKKYKINTETFKNPVIQ
jgi:hypothetical protein